MNINEFKNHLKDKSKEELIDMMLSMNENMNKNKESDKKLNLSLGVVKILEIIKNNDLLNEEIILNIAEKFDNENKTIVSKMFK
jgi:hypothetical protein